MRAEEARAMAKNVRNKHAAEWYKEAEPSIIGLINKTVDKGEFSCKIDDDSPLGKGLFQSQEHRQYFEEKLKQYGYKVTYYHGSYQDETSSYHISWA